MIKKILLGLILISFAILYQNCSQMFELQDSAIMKKSATNQSGTPTPSPSPRPSPTTTPTPQLTVLQNIDFYTIQKVISFSQGGYRFDDGNFYKTQISFDHINYHFSLKFITWNPNLPPPNNTEHLEYPEYVGSSAEYNELLTIFSEFTLGSGVAAIGSDGGEQHLTLEYRPGCVGAPSMGCVQALATVDFMFKSDFINQSREEVILDSTHFGSFIYGIRTSLSQ